MAHFFPDLRAWMRAVGDSRRQEQIIYKGPFLIWMGLMLFLLKLGARRRLNFELDSPMALVNLNRLSGCAQQDVADHGTLEHYLGHVPCAQLHALRRQVVRRLIRMRVLDDARLMGHLLLVFDGTGQLYFRHRHCEHCLTQTHDGTTRYYHHVLEAKLVTPEGLAISLDSEFIENADPEATKQDCERKAFGRLAARIKRDFPQLRLCLCLDALYANGPVLDLCRQNGWKFFITFEQGSLSAVWRDYQALRTLCPENRAVRTSPGGPRQEFTWVQDLSYVDDRGHPQSFHVLQCREQGHEEAFVWLTNFALRADNVATLANRGGRQRWKIENQGFNIQKNGGFNLEHAFSLSNQQIKNYYVLLQIAHTILQLIEHGNLLSRHAKDLFGSLRDLARRLAESLRHYEISPEAVDPTVAASLRIRLDSG